MRASALARKALVAGNWKLNGTRSSAVALAESIAAGGDGVQAELVVCPVALHLADVAAVLDGRSLKLGAQNASSEDSGAFTGEIAAPMLAEYGCEYVIVGHSERRALFNETDLKVAERFAAVRRAGLKPILCVGETLEEREADAVNAVIARQLEAVINDSGIAAFTDAVIAYEPVWAIGTGRTASPGQAQEVHALIRDILAREDQAIAAGCRILYGGSVKPDNAAELFAQTDIDGGLIGGAALDAESFLAIGRAAG